MDTVSILMSYYMFKATQLRR